MMRYASIWWKFSFSLREIDVCLTFFWPTISTGVWSSPSYWYVFHSTVRFRILLGSRMKSVCDRLKCNNTEQNIFSSVSIHQSQYTCSSSSPPTVSSRLTCLCVCCHLHTSSSSPIASCILRKAKKEERIVCSRNTDPGGDSVWSLVMCELLHWAWNKRVDWMLLLFFFSSSCSLILPTPHTTYSYSLFTFCGHELWSKKEYICCVARNHTHHRWTSWFWWCFFAPLNCVYVSFSKISPVSRFPSSSWEESHVITCSTVRG